MTIGKQTILAERMERQGLVQPVTTPEEYSPLFRRLQPISPIYYAMPGVAPSLVHRTTFDDMKLNDEWRSKREIVKGRFLRGTIGYVFGDDLALYANAFQRPLERYSRNQDLVYETLAHVGPLTPRQIKEETGLLNKEIMPILHRLQQAFLVYEDQVDTDWERAWYLFSQEWPGVSVSPERWEEAAREVLRRFLYAHVFATAEHIKDWSGWGVKEIKHLLDSLENDGVINSLSVDGPGDGWIHTEDLALGRKEPPRSVFMLHKADPLVCARMSELKRRFAGLEVLQYLLIDGDFLGAVCGHWRIGPHDVEDIVVNLSSEERTARKDEIIEAVAWKYRAPAHNILRYDSEQLTV